MGPWRTEEAAIPAWSHNPTVVYAPADQTWILYHIGNGEPNGPIQVCNHTQLDPHRDSRKGQAASPRSPGSLPFSLHTSTSLEGPWTRWNGTGGEMATPPLFTHYPGTLARHVGRWISGHFVESFPNGLVLHGGPLGVDNVGSEDQQHAILHLGAMASAAECLSACADHSECTSYTHRAAGGTGVCLGRRDGLWFPNSTNASATVTSGRPWTFDGDNPAPYLDPVTGEVTVLYRQDSNSAAWLPGHSSPQPTLASLIRLAKATS